ncbi:MAG: putative integral membrane protein [uncultured archaeon A07HR67]|nr:MAG: putative integral membrane protein [uncultured archaeon A07HR67]
MSGSTRDDATAVSEAPESETENPRDRWRNAAAFAGVVLLASVVPVPGSGGRSGAAADGLLAGIAPTDPFHLVGYALLAGLSARAMPDGVRWLGVAVGVTVGFGLGVELVQTAVPWRAFAWRDAAVNALGASVGVLIVGVRSGSIRDDWRYTE